MNPYNVLGVPPDAPEHELRRAYVSLVRRWHPDRFSDPRRRAYAEEQMKAVTEAWRIVSRERRHGGFTLRERPVRSWQPFDDDDQPGGDPEDSTWEEPLDGGEIGDSVVPVPLVMAPLLVVASLLLLATAVVLRAKPLMALGGLLGAVGLLGVVASPLVVARRVSRSHRSGGGSR
ncbi:MAG: hypothetical protein KatS3mg008_0119 [Acidimicrobiales bacterium]|nr:MAG: hypothetical protein KatS3mg008_0119 [Acidimicrobiales bacterium]